MVFWILFFGSSSIYSQSYENKGYVKQDESIEKLLQAHRQVNKNQRGIEGFRVQIYTDSGNRSKLRTDRMKSEFDSRYPHVNSYIDYVEPNYRLRVGNFRNRLDAHRFLKQISSSYPLARVVADRINFPALTEKDPIYFDQDNGE